MTEPTKMGFPWAEFLAERRRMIIYLRKADGLTWEQIAHRLSCDPEQCRLIYMGRNDKRVPDPNASRIAAKEDS